MKHSIYFFQFGYKYGNELFLPYSVGILWSYSKQFKEITDNFENKGFFFIRENPDDIIKNIVDPDICAFSCYVWNWEMTMEVAKRVKKKYPKCLIIIGGPQVPDKTSGFFKKYPFVDIMVHNEGEVVIYEILKEYLNYDNEDYSKIAGTTVKGNDHIEFVRQPAIVDLDATPSPYLTGVFDNLLNLPYSFQPIWETNRGCPYPCTFCEWGAIQLNKLRAYSDERLMKEIEWFAEKRIAYVFGADANFGIVPRDVTLAEKFAIMKRKTKFPSKFRVSFAKNTTDRVMHIAEILNKEDLDKGISLSVQSMDEATLKIIKRRNLKIDSLVSFVREYYKKGIPTFTEVIMGLPGETYDSYADGINKLFECNIHDSVVVYLCSVLPNTELNNENYKAIHQIKTLRVPVFLWHSIPGEDPVQEYEDIIVSTRYSNTEDLKKQYIFTWLVTLFHVMNLTQIVAIACKKLYNISYRKFYEALWEFAKNNRDTIIGKELTFAEEQANKTYVGQPRGTVLPEFSNISWGDEEASYLRISQNIDKFYEELDKFIDNNPFFHVNHIYELEWWQSIMKYQHAIVVKCNINGSQEFEVKYPIHSFYRAHLIGDKVDFKEGRYKISIIDDVQYNGNKERYSREAIWWGRKNGKCTYKQIEEVKL